MERERERERDGDDDGERTGAARCCCALPGSARSDAGCAAAAVAAAAAAELRDGAGAADQRGERLQPPPAVLQPGGGHQDHRHGDLRGGGGRQDRARPVLQAGRRPGVRGPEPDHPGERNQERLIPTGVDQWWICIGPHGVRELVKTFPSLTSLFLIIDVLPAHVWRLKITLMYFLKLYRRVITLLQCVYDVTLWTFNAT